MATSEKDIGTTATCVPGSVATGDRRPVLSAPPRPPIGPTMKDYSDSHCATFCACEIDNGLARNVVTKIGHYSAIIEAHFPNAQEVYRALEAIAALKTWNECATASPQVRQTKADLSNSLDAAIASARAAFAKGEAA